MTTKPTINKDLFWDNNFEQLDFHKNKVFIVERVFNYGTQDDVKQLLRFYPENDLKNIVLEVPNFTRKTLSFVSNFFEIPLAQFKCYTKRQSTPGYWNY